VIPVTASSGKSQSYLDVGLDVTYDKGKAIVGLEKMSPQMTELKGNLPENESTWTFESLKGLTDILGRTVK